MPCRSCRIFAAALGALLPFTALFSLAAAAESQRVLPETTRAWFSVSAPQQVDLGWRKTRLAAMGKDMTMKPFLDAAQKSFEKTTGDLRAVADITLDDLQEAAGGEVSVSAVELEGDKLALAALADVAGKTAEVEKLIAKIDAGLKRRGATHTPHTVGDVTLHAYHWKDREGQPRSSAYALRSNTLVVSGDVELAKSLLERVAAPDVTSLADNPGYRDVIDRATAASAGLAPQVRWYLDPMRFGEILSGEEPKFARKHGFDGIKAVGGTIHFDAAGCDTLARVAVYAPEPRKGALRMLALVDGGDAPPLPWAVDDLDSYTELNLDLAQVLDNAGGLFDDLVADGIAGTFEDILKDLKSDEGPGVDVRTELLPIIGPRVVVMSDHVEPHSPESDRTLIAFQTSNPVAAADIVERLMRDDPDVHHEALPGQPNELWRVANVETAAYPNMGMMVAHGYLVVANNAELIRKVVGAPPGGPVIGASADYTQVAGLMTDLGSAGAAVRIFSRTSRAYHPSYDEVRSGKLDELRTMTGDLVRRLFGKDEERLAGLPKLDFSTLPEFDAVKRYLPPVGVFVKNQPTGWLVVGLIPR